MSEKVSFSLLAKDKEKLDAIAEKANKPLAHVTAEVVERYLHNCDNPKTEKPIQKIVIEQFNDDHVDAVFYDINNNVCKIKRSLIKDGCKSFIEQSKDILKDLASHYSSPRPGVWVSTYEGMLGKVSSIQDFQVVLDGYEWPVDYKAITGVHNEPKYKSKSRVLIGNDNKEGEVVAPFIDGMYLVTELARPHNGYRSSKKFYKESELKADNRPNRKPWE